MSNRIVWLILTKCNPRCPFFQYGNELFDDNLCKSENRKIPMRRECRFPDWCPLEKDMELKIDP